LELFFAVSGEIEKIKELVWKYSDFNFIKKFKREYKAFQQRIYAFHLRKIQNSGLAILCDAFGTVGIYDLNSWVDWDRSTAVQYIYYS
jgi:hypothetical protein